jgi:hypothetical protein
MKKAKIMLAVIAALAIVGGTLAFRAKVGTHRFFGYGTTTVVGGITTGCVVPLDIPYTTTTCTVSDLAVYTTSTIPLSLLDADVPCVTYVVAIQ